MTSRARTLDVIICGIEPSRVYYGFPVGQLAVYYADIYPEGNFDLSSIQVAKRYCVQTVEMPCRVVDRETGRTSTMLRYVWVDAKEVTPQAPLQTDTAKQRKAKAALAAMPLVDDGTLFRL